MNQVQIRAEAALRLRQRQGISSSKWGRYANDPAAFANDVLGLTVWSRQAEVLTASLEHGKTAVKAGRKVSKSNTIAVLAIHNALCRGQPTLLTSSSFDQLKGIIWAEINRLASGLPLHVPLDPRTGFTTLTGGSVTGRSTNRRENMQGYSGHDALYIGDEASGLSVEIVEALEGNLAGGGRLMLFGNPTMTSGPFYEAFHAKRNTWHSITISSRESPNVTGEAKIPGLATPEWIRDTEADNGRESAFVEVHVDGRFPTTGSTTVISLKTVEEAKARYGDASEVGELRLGLDVARYGDDLTVLQPVRGERALLAPDWHGLDGPNVAGRVLEWLAAYRRDTGFEQRVICNVDVIGVGASAFDALNHSDRARELGLEAVAINVAEKATSRPREGGYAKLRDQLWFGLRDWLEEGGSIPENAHLEQELIAPNYGFDSQGRYKVESKDEVRDRIRRSTNYADALALAIYRAPTPEPTPVIGIESTSRWRI